MKGVAVLLFVCFVSLSIESGSALKCYSCGGDVGKKTDCEDDVKKVPSLECPAETPVCMTLITKGDKAGIIRSCSVKDACKNVDSSIKKYCDTCTKDLCNDKNSGFVASYSTSIAVSVVLFTLSKLFM